MTDHFSRCDMKRQEPLLYPSSGVCSFPKLLVLALPLTSYVTWSRSLPLCGAQSLSCSKICSNSDIQVPHIICTILGGRF